MTIALYAASVRAQLRSTDALGRGRLEVAVEQSRLDAERRFAVLFLDLDRFKIVNDSLGHSAGDEFLIQVSRRIQDGLRPHDVVARLGGDEFVVLLSDLDTEPATASRTCTPVEPYSSCSRASSVRAGLDGT